MPNRIIYLSHGAGPLPVLGDERHTEMVANLRHIAATMERPEAILVVSAHWEEAVPTVTAGSTPPLLYDYYGFPQESYELEYPAPGNDDLGASVRDALAKAGFDTAQDEERGYDHGLFVPLLLMYPEADIPCVQLSLVKGLGPATHLALGRALRELDQQNLLIVGSGFSYHNMRGFFEPDTPETRERNAAFQDWIVDTCANEDRSDEDRRKRMEDWESAPGARWCHPREEHLIPLHVCCGAAGRPATEHFTLDIFGKQATALRW